MTKEQKELKKSWLQIMAILKETGYDYLYMKMKYTNNFRSYKEF